MELLKQYLLSSLLDNILPLTSVCNVNCIFCSHRQNPPGIESFFLPPLEWEEIEDLVSYLSPVKKIVIGESTTRIMEGEPFTHPRLMAILQLIRQRLPLTPIQITTNGTLLTKEILLELKKLEPLEIIISLNSACPCKRTELMGTKGSTQAILAVELMAQEHISFHGSIVALPWLTGWEDLEYTLDYLDKFQAQTTRIFLPGFTRYQKDIPTLPEGWENELEVYVRERRRNYMTPLTLEPAGLTNLQAFITGVVKDSPAQRAGLNCNDEILAINGLAPFSRVEAFYMLNKSGVYVLDIRRELGISATVQLTIGEGEKSGLVMDYDLDPVTIDQLCKNIKKARVVKPLILASQWGEPLLRTGLLKAGLEQLAGRVLAVANLTFAGNIKAAGLLLVDDFAATFRQFISEGGEADYLVLPAVAFDSRGRDLQGINYLSLEEKFKIKVQLV